jgi:sugar phosphate isomerase/epimerase
MLAAGLVSITFRRLPPAEIITLVRETGTECIEWGGDVHVPHGQVAVARDVGERTRAAGLRVAAYGSYYRLHGSEAAGLSFAAVLDSAVALGAPVIRVWAGQQGSAQADAAYRAGVIADAQRIGSLAGAAGVTVALEYHGQTLTDTNASAQQLMREIAHPHVAALWQPHQAATGGPNLAGVRGMLPWLRHVHCFHWQYAERVIRRPLAEGAADWRAYLAVVRETGRAHDVLIEFVAGDDPAQFRRDAATLHGWLAEQNALLRATAP